MEEGVRHNIGKTQDRAGNRNPYNKGGTQKESAKYAVESYVWLVQKTQKVG